MRIGEIDINLRAKITAISTAQCLDSKQKKAENTQGVIISWSSKAGIMVMMVTVVQLLNVHNADVMVIED